LTATRLTTNSRLQVKLTERGAILLAVRQLRTSSYTQLIDGYREYRVNDNMVMGPAFLRYADPKFEVAVKELIKPSE